MATTVPRTAALSADRLASAPIPVLLAATGAIVEASGITDDGFFGAVIERRDGQIVLAMPPGRPELERDIVTRHLLAEVLGIRLPGRPTLACRELAGVPA